MKLVSIVLMTFSLILLGACGGDGGNSPSNATPGDGNKPDDLRLTIDSDNILAKEYYLKAPLVFSDSEAKDSTLAKGTSLERSVRTFTKQYQGQKLVKTSDNTSSKSFCSIQVETSPRTKASDLELPQGYLRKGQFSESVSSQVRNEQKNEMVTFSLYFQTGAFQGFFLNCTNVVNADGIRDHVGHLIDVTDRKPTPTKPVLKNVSPKKISIQYTSDNSDPAGLTINHVVSFAKKDLPNEKRFTLDLNVYLNYPGQTRRKLAGPIRVHNAADVIAGPLLVTFAFGKNDIFTDELIHRMRLVEYEFVTKKNSGLKIKMSQMCSSQSSGFLDLSKGSGGCPKHITSTLMTKTMLAAADKCSNDEFSPSKIGQVFKRQTRGEKRQGSPCQVLIWDLLESGLSQSQVSSIHFYTRSIKGRVSCEKFRSDLSYHYIREDEDRDALIFGHGTFEPVSDSNLYELCLAQNS